MTANRTAGRTLGALAAVAVVAGVGLLALAPPPGVALASPGVYGLALLGAGGGLLVALGYLSTSAADSAEQPTAAPEPESQPAPEPTIGSDPDPEPAPAPTPTREPAPDPAPAPAPNATAGSGNTGSVQELFEGSTDDGTDDIDALLEGADEDSSFEFADEEPTEDDRD